MYRYLQNWHIINHGDGYPLRLTRLPNNEPYSRLPNIEFDGFNLISHLTHSHPHARSCWFTDTRRSAEQPEVGAAKLLSHFRPLMQFESIHSSPTVSIVICWSILPTCYNRHLTPTRHATSSANKSYSRSTTSEDAHSKITRANSAIFRMRTVIQHFMSHYALLTHCDESILLQFTECVMQHQFSQSTRARLPVPIVAKWNISFSWVFICDFVRQHVGRLIRLASTILSSEKVIQENLPWTAYFAIRRRFPITSDALARVQI